MRGLAPRHASAVSGASRLGRLGASANPDYRRATNGGQDPEMRQWLPSGSQHHDAIQHVKTTMVYCCKTMFTALLFCLDIYYVTSLLGYITYCVALEYIVLYNTHDIVFYDQVFKNVIYLEHSYITYHMVYHTLNSYQPIYDIHHKVCNMQYSIKCWITRMV